MSELISVIVPVYNVEQYLDNCMDSILKQTYKNIEIILVDDGATDNSGIMCDYYAEVDERVKVIHKENGGLSDARNKGISCATGEYIMFVDSDDVICPDLIEYLYNLIVECSSDISICDPVHCYPDKEIIFEQETSKRIFEPEDAIVEMLYQKSFLVSAWGKLFRKDFFNDILFPYGILFEDSAVMYKIFDKANRIVYGNAKLYGYMHREGSITTQKFSKRECDILTISEEIMDKMSNGSEKLLKAARAYRTAAVLRIYMNAPRNGDFDVELKACSDFLKENINLVLYDKEIRKKMKLALLMYKYTRPLMPMVYKRINRWK